MRLIEGNLLPEENSRNYLSGCHDRQILELYKINAHSKEKFKAYCDNFSWEPDSSVPVDNDVSAGIWYVGFPELSQRYSAILEWKFGAGGMRSWKNLARGTI